MTTELASGTLDGRKWRIIRQSGRLLWRHDDWLEGTPALDLNEAPWVLALLARVQELENATEQARSIVEDVYLFLRERHDLNIESLSTAMQVLAQTSPSRKEGGA